MKLISHIKLVGIYLLISFYSVILFKPLLPLAKDFIAHAYFELEHLNTIHFENGKYHLHQEIQKDLKDQSKQSNSKIAELQIDVHYIAPLFSITAFQKIESINELSENGFYVDLIYDQNFLLVNSPPPKI